MLTHTPPHLLSARCPNRNEQGITLQTLIITAVLVLLASTVGTLIVSRVGANSNRTGFLPQERECRPYERYDPLLAAQWGHTEVKLPGRGWRFAYSHHAQRLLEEGVIQDSEVRRPVADPYPHASGPGCIRACWSKVDYRGNSDFPPADDIHPGNIQAIVRASALAQFPIPPGEDTQKEEREDFEYNYEADLRQHWAENTEAVSGARVSQTNTCDRGAVFQWSEPNPNPSI